MSFPTRKSAAGEGLYQPQADINVTPLVDVMLVLLIIFMVTAPLLATGVKVELPQAKAAQPLNPKEPVVVTVGKDGKVSLGPDEVPVDLLVDAVRGKLGDDIAQVIHVRGDKDASFGEVVGIMDRLATNGITHIALITAPNSRKDQAPPAKTDEAPPTKAEPKP